MEQKFLIIGRLLGDLRRKKQVKMDDLCKGICSKALLSRIENGEVAPDVFLTEALFTRLGVDAPLELVPVTKEQSKRMRITKQIDLIANGKDERRVELIEEYKKGKPLNKFEKQYCALVEGWNLGTSTEKLKISLKMYEEALKITIPDFSVKNDEMPKQLLSNLERALINNIANSEYYMYDFNKNDESSHKRALLRINFLKNYYENFVEDYENTRMYSIILFNLTNWTGLDGDFEKSLQLAQKGFSIEKKSLNYYALHLFNMGFSLAEFKEFDKAKIYIKKSLGILKLIQPRDAYNYVISELKQRFGFDFN